MPIADETCPMPESRMQAILAADVAGGQRNPALVRRIAREVAATHGGRIFDAPGESVFALYDNALDAVGAAIAVQAGLKERALPGPPLRIGVHLGEVLFHEGRPFGETLIVAALLEGIAEPGGILVSAEITEAVASQLSATFEDCGLRAFAQTPRRIATFRVRTAELSFATAASSGPALNETLLGLPPGVAQPAPPQRDGVGDVPPEFVAVAPAPQAVRLDQTVLALPEGGAPAPSASVLPPGTWRDPLTRALASRLGPIAPVIVKREAAAAVTLAELIERLAEAIPSSREGAEFRAEAAKLLPGSNS